MGLAECFKLDYRPVPQKRLTGNTPKDYDKRVAIKLV